MQHKIVHGTGLMDDYDMYGDGEYEFGKGVVSGGASSYNMFVKRYAKKHRVSIPEAAHAIKRKGLWKGTSTKRKKKRTTLKRSRTTVKRRPVKRSTIKRSRTTVKRRPVKRRMRGRGIMGGATIEELRDYMKSTKSQRENTKKQREYNRYFNKLLCDRMKQRFLNGEIVDIDNPDEVEDFRQKLESCMAGLRRKTPKEKIARQLTSAEKNFLLKYYLDSLDTLDFGSRVLEKKNVI